MIDPRTLRPLDLDTILESVRKTNRCVIVEEGWPHGGVGANLAALIQEQAFDDLDAPVGRVTGADVPMPYSKPLEQIAFPHEPQVVAGRARHIPGPLNAPALKRRPALRRSPRVPSDAPPPIAPCRARRAPPRADRRTSRARSPRGDASSAPTRRSARLLGATADESSAHAETPHPPDDRGGPVGAGSHRPAASRHRRGRGARRPARRPAPRCLLSLHRPRRRPHPPTRRDVHDRRRAAERASEAHALFRSAFEQSAIGMCRHARRALSPRHAAYAQLVGRAPEELVGMPVARRPPRRRRRPADMRRSLVADPALDRAEKRYVRPGGREVWGALNASVVLGPDGRPAVPRPPGRRPRRPARRRGRAGRQREPLPHAGRRVAGRDLRGVGRRADAVRQPAPAARSTALGEPHVDEGPWSARRRRRPRRLLAARRGPRGARR